MKTKDKKVNKLWGTAFSEEPSKLIQEFTSGRDVIPVHPADYNLLSYDIWGSKVHSIMLYKQGIISKTAVLVILKGLLEVEKLYKANKFHLDKTKEDVHTNIESWLIKKFGIDHAGKLHTARSRNDQSSLDTRLYLRDQVLLFIQQTLSLNKKLIVGADRYKKYVMPGFTHHQHAMITTFGHILLGFANMLIRDTERFTHWYKLHNVNPLGNSVGYGTLFPIDRDLTTKLLAFDYPEISSFDEITNRWEAEADLAFDVTILMNHLSSLSQTLILLSMPEFEMVKLADQFSTGSSIMPQKKNPDTLEAVKAKASYIAGQLQGLLNLGKANFIGYNKDSQWTKYLIMDLIREACYAPEIIGGIIETIKVNKEQMLYWANKRFIGTTSLLEQITSKYKIPFRKAKIIVEEAVRYSQGDKVNYKNLKKALEEEGINILISKSDVEKWQNPNEILKLTKSFGGPGLTSYDASKKIISQQLEKLDSWFEEKTNQKEKAISCLNSIIKNLISQKTYEK